MAALEAALERAGRAQTPHERLTALEAIHEARERLDEALARVREELALGQPPSKDVMLS